MQSPAVFVLHGNGNSSLHRQNRSQAVSAFCYKEEGKNNLFHKRSFLRKLGKARQFVKEQVDNGRSVKAKVELLKVFNQPITVYQGKNGQIYGMAAVAATTTKTFNGMPNLR